MAILWRINQRDAPRGLVWSVVHRPGRVAGPDIGLDDYFGLIGVATLGQGSQTVDAVGDIVAATAGVGQGSQTLDAVGLVKSDAVGDTGQGSQTFDGLIAQVLDATGDTGQGSQSVQAYGDAHTPIPFYGAYDMLWRLNPRDQNFGFVSATVAQPMRNYGAIGTDLYWGSFTTVVTGQGGQTIDAAGTVGAAPYVETGQGGQTIDAAGSASWAPIDIVATLGQGGQSLSGAIAARLNATVTMRQGSQSINAVGDVDNFFVVGVGLQSATLWGSAVLYNQTQQIYPVGDTQTQWGATEAVGPRSYTAVGVENTQWGSTTVAHWTHYVLQASAGSQQMFGIPHVRDALQVIQPEGWDSLAGVGAVYVADTVPPFDVIQVDDNFAETRDFAEFGTPLVQNTSNRGVYPSGWSSLTFGTARTDPLFIYPEYDSTHVKGGWNSNSFGRPFVSNYTRYIYPTGWSALSTGRPWASFLIRDLYPEGWTASIVWDEFGPLNPDDGLPAHVAHLTDTHYVYPVGFEAMELDGCYNEHPFFGEPKVVGGAPAIRPTGWDSMDFGANYERADYDTDDYFANDGATLVRHD